jgi:hypothetical protein
MKYLQRVSNALGSIPSKRAFFSTRNTILKSNQILLGRECDKVLIWVIDNGRDCEVRIYNNKEDYDDKTRCMIAFRFTICEEGIWINNRTERFNSSFDFDQHHITEILETVRKEFALRRP